MKRNKTLNHESAFGTNCTAVAYTFRRREFRKKKEKKRTLWLQEALFYTYVFYIVLSDYEGKRKESPSVNEVRFTDSLE